MLTIHLNLPHVKAGLIGPKLTITLLTSSRIISVYVCVYVCVLSIYRKNHKKISNIIPHLTSDLS